MNEQEKQHQDCTNEFIDLANRMKDKGVDPAIVSAALMMASSIYATYVSAGNEGALQPSGVTKVVSLYQNTLERYQEIKKNQLMKQKIG